MSRFLSFLASMRLAISLLAVVGIASSIGTLIKQNEPQVNYLNQFGPFWFEIFQLLGFFNIYSSLPFLAILTFLLMSTSLCVWRQTPAIWRDFRSQRRHAHWQALQQFPHHYPLTINANYDETILRRALHSLGGKISLETMEGGGMASIRHGQWQRLGYVFTHVAIIVICGGGLLDGQFPLRIQTLMGYYQPVPFVEAVERLPEKSILPADHASFRANVFIPEGERRDLGLVVINNGRLWQKLPFSVELKKFIIAHYENGMPKNFQSELVIHRNEDTPQHSTIPLEGLSTPIFVNKPLHVDGYTIYQAGFDDGGSTVSLAGYSLDTLQALPSMSAAIGDKASYSNHQERYVLELGDFRSFNVERRSREDEDKKASLSWLDTLRNLSGTAGRDISNHTMRNFGPKLTYKLRNNAGQAVEVQTYMLPVELEDGQWYWLSGIRENSTESFRYLRVPIVDGDGLETWMAIRRLLHNDDSRTQIVKRYLLQTQQPRQASLLSDAINKATLTFVQKGLGFIDQLVAPSTLPSSSSQTLNVVEGFSEDQRLKVAEVFVSIIRGVIFEAWKTVRQQSGKSIPLENQISSQYVQDVMMSFHSAVHYPSPLIFQLTSYEEKPATVLQVARAPGQGLVYLGCALLVLGIMLMIFVQDRRLYVWWSKDAQSPSFVAGVVRRGPKLTDEQFIAIAQTIEQNLSSQH